MRNAAIKYFSDPGPPPKADAESPGHIHTYDEAGDQEAEEEEDLEDDTEMLGDAEDVD